MGHRRKAVALSRVDLEVYATGLRYATAPNRQGYGPPAAGLRVDDAESMESLAKRIEVDTLSNDAESLGLWATCGRPPR